MGRRIIGGSVPPNYSNYVLNAVDGTTNPTSPVTDIRLIDDVGYGLIWTGTLNGVVTVQISPDNVQWFPLPGFTVNGPAGSPGRDYVDIVPTSALWIRVSYVNTSGTGNITAIVCGKGI